MLSVARPAFPPAPLLNRKVTRHAASAAGVVSASGRATVAGATGKKPARERPVILVVDDEHDLVELISMNLERNGFDALAAEDGEAAIELAKRHQPDLILLDLMLPGVDGTEVARRLRDDAKTKDVPIVMLTARGEETDVVVGLTIGADDYVVKPVSPKVLMARVKAVLRRRGPIHGEMSTQDNASPGSLTSGPLTMDLDKHEVYADGKLVKLTLTEFKLLRALVEAGGRVLSRDRLMDKAMGTDVFVTDRAIDVHVTAIRKKLGDASWLVHTVRGVGYRLQDAGPDA
jgi:two-component system phosphate regulon response regulator PhoB